MQKLKINFCAPLMTIMCNSPLEVGFTSAPSWPVRMQTKIFIYRHKDLFTVDGLITTGSKWCLRLKTTLELTCAACGKIKAHFLNGFQVPFLVLFFMITHVHMNRREKESSIYAWPYESRMCLKHCIIYFKQKEIFCEKYFFLNWTLFTNFIVHNCLTNIHLC